MYTKNIFYEDWKKKRLNREKIYIFVDDDAFGKGELKLIEMTDEDLQKIRKILREGEK